LENKVNAIEPDEAQCRPSPPPSAEAELEALRVKYRLVEESLRESQVKLAGILAIAHEAIIAVDEQQRITLFNKGAETIFGYTAAEMIGRPLELLLPARYRAIHYHYVSDFAISGESARLMDVRGEVIGRRKDGREFPAEASISKIEANNEITLMVVLRDITERKQAEIKQQNLIEELNAFAHTVSHDLNAPLGLITAYAYLLKEEARLPDEQHHYLNAIIRSSHKMNNIINELQLLAGVRKAQVALTPLNMARIVAEAQQRLTYMIEEYGAQINSPEDWPAALGYAPWVEQVWVNYISNAIRYGGQPPRLRLGSTVRSDGFIRFWVRDNGPGLSPEAQRGLFKPFIQFDQVRAQGHGLGLSIVQRIIERLGGQVGVESEGLSGQGCTFFFTLQQAGPPADLLNE
jgi:PAS domain S-box-containing protein